MSGFEPVFRVDDIYNHVDNFIDEQISKMEMVAARVGEKFVNISRSSGNYTDQTSNLRNSIGYSIIKDGKVIVESTPGETSNGVNAAKEALNSIISEMDSDEEIFILGTAGMEYAAAVQSLDGYDVISIGATAAEKLLEKYLKALG